MGTDHAGMREWLGRPTVAVTMVLLIAATFYHLKLGVQVVIEDYVHHGAIKLVSLVLLNFATVVLAVAGIYSVLSIAFRG